MISGICPRLVGSWWWDPKRTPAFPSQLGKNPKAAVLPVCDRSLSAGFCQGALRIPPAALTSKQPPGCRVFPCAPSPPLYNFPPSLLGAEAKGMAVAVPAAFWGAGELTAAWNLPIPAPLPVARLGQAVRNSLKSKIAWRGDGFSQTCGFLHPSIGCRGLTMAKTTLQLGYVAGLVPCSCPAPLFGKPACISCISPRP